MRKLIQAGILGLVSMFVVTSAHAATLAPLQVFTRDDVTMSTIESQAAQPDEVTLEAGYIAEDDNNLYLTWEVKDFPAQLQDSGAPAPFFYYWDFQLPDASNTTTHQAAFELTARPSAMVFGQDVPTRRVQVGGGSIASNCGNQLSSLPVSVVTLTGCTTVANSAVNVTWDFAAHTITAQVRRTDLRGANGQIVAIDGAKLTDVKLFLNIAACINTGATSGSTCESATMQGPYTLGPAGRTA
ncbi:MAG: hypothetical protein ABR552_08870 [Actinomycetota bacterium]